MKKISALHEYEDEENEAEESEENGENKADSYICIACRHQHEQWAARCSECNAWSSIKSERDVPSADNVDDYDEEENQEGPFARPIDDIDQEDACRVPTGISELDRVLGGGAVLGCVTLVGGDPGVGKSTLLLQALASISALGARTLYVTAEESASQVAARAQRIKNVAPDNLFLLAETRTERILREINDIKPQVMVIDSVQTIHTSDGNAGSVSQLRDVTALMIAAAKRRPKNEKIATFLVGHVTKDGGLAGPKVLEHIVDTVLAFEGEKGQAFRTLRTQKNRYGSSTEVGIFEMTAGGMREVPNASEFFLAERNQEACGSIIAATSEGNRSMLVEVQALVSPIKPTGGRVIANGMDSARVTMILAVLDRSIATLTGIMAGKNLQSRDIFLNVAGGVTINEPALDLPIALAIASALFEIPIPPHVVAFGEIGLTGEVRGVPRVPTRLTEAATMGFEIAMVPRSVSGTKEDKEVLGKNSPLGIEPVRTLSQALQMLTQKPVPKQPALKKKAKKR